jgi:uncharacterized membrane protein YvbJ
MFCPKCGTFNQDTAVICNQCGVELTPARGTVASQPGTTAGTYVPNYLVFAILTTVFCCLPTGIAAIVYASQVNTKLAVGDIAGAQAASKNAKTWCLVSVGAGLLIGVLYALLAVLGVMSHRQSIP